MVESLPEELERMRATLALHLHEMRHQYRVDSPSLCGSYVHGDQRPGSALDVLVTFTSTPGLLEFVGLRLYLTDLLGVDVDLVMKSALKPPYRPADPRRSYSCMTAERTYPDYLQDLLGAFESAERFVCG